MRKDLKVEGHSFWIGRKASHRNWVIWEGKSLGNRELRGASKGKRTYCRSARAGERNRMISYEEDKAVRKAILEFFTSMERNLSSYLGCRRERPSHWNL